MTGDTPAADVAPAADAVDLLADAPAADAAPVETKADDKPAAESKPADDKKAGDDGAKPEAKAEGDLLADDDEGKSPEDKDGQADKSKDGAPETYEALTLPEGVPIDEAALVETKKLFGEEKISLATANKLVAHYANMQKAAAEQTLAGFNKVKSDWKAEIKADQEFGGDKLPQTVGAAMAVIGKFGDKALLNDLREWGWANHPGLIRLLARVNAQLSPDNLVTADAAVQTAPKSAAERLWPSMFENKE